MVEYDPATFAVKQTVKVPAGAVQSPANVSVNRLGQILFGPPVSLPLAEEDAASAHKVWFWNGSTATTMDEGVKRETSTTGSNQAITETAAVAYLSADSMHLFWFANQARRLQREGLDLSTDTTWQAWQTDLTGAGRQELATAKFPGCRLYDRVVRGKLSVRRGVGAGRCRREVFPDDAVCRGTDWAGIQGHHELSRRRWKVDSQCPGRASTACARCDA